MSFAHPSAEPSKELRKLITPSIRSDINKLAGAASVNRSHDVKWVGGRSENGRTVYIDKDIPRKLDAGKSYDPAKTLPWHEIPEWYLMHELDLPYSDAHSLATHEFEKPRVEALGLDWRKYQEGWGGEIEHNEKKAFGPAPKDLDKSPYLEGGKISASEAPDMTPDMTMTGSPDPDQDGDMHTPVMAGGMSGGPTPGEANPQPNSLDQAQSQHRQLSAGYKKLTEAKALLDKVRAGMDQLASLGDMITHDDVVKEAGKLVAAGLDPSAMASILADMPPEGEALAAWVQQHDQEIAQRESQLEQMTDAVRHEMGTSAMHMLAMHHLKGQVESGTGASLGPQAPSANGASNAPVSGMGDLAGEAVSPAAGAGNALGAAAGDMTGMEMQNG